MDQQSNTSTGWQKANPEDTDSFIKNLKEWINFFNNHFHLISLDEIRKMKLSDFQIGHVYEIKQAIDEVPGIALILIRKENKIFISLGLKSHHIMFPKYFQVGVDVHFNYLRSLYKLDWCIFKEWETSEELLDWLSTERTLWATSEVQLNQLKKLIPKIKEQLQIIVEYIYFVYDVHLKDITQ